MSAIKLGIYEKALRSRSAWGEYFAAAAEAGFSFVDLSVDETAQRIERLTWSASQREQVRRAAAQAGVELGGICLSVHRRVAPASREAKQREQARLILRQGVELCADLGIPVLQLAGYHAYYEAPEADTAQLFTDFLNYAAEYASLFGVMLGIENVDTSGITSISAGRRAVEEVNSPWLRLYPDIGNLTEQQLDEVSELAAGQGLMLAIHVKDTRPGEPRRVPMGGGQVPWEAAFAELRRQNWSGRMMIEMWNDDSPDSEATAAAAREFIAEKLAEAQFMVVKN